MSIKDTKNYLRTIIAAMLMLMTMGSLNYLSHGESIPLNKPFSTFPKQIGEWTGEKGHFAPQIYAKLGVDDSILCNYHTPNGQQVELYIGFYRSQQKGDLIHSPKNCMPGAGWNFVKTKKTSLKVGAQSTQDNITVNNILLQKGHEKLVMFYWYQGRGRFITSEYMQKIYLVIDSITKHRTDEAFVRLLSPVTSDNEEKAVESLKDFASCLLPLLHEYMPS